MVQANLAYFSLVHSTFSTPATEESRMLGNGSKAGIFETRIFPTEIADCHKAKPNIKGSWIREILLKLLKYFPVSLFLGSRL